MKKTLLIVLLSAPILLLAQSGVKVLNVSNTNNTPVEKTIAIDPIGSKPDQIQIKTTADAKTKKEQNFTGVELGKTFYDLQTNSSPGRRIVLHADGTISAVWTASPTDASGFPNRGTGYNYFDGTDWLTDRDTRIESTLRTGWPSIMTLEDGSDAIMAHESNTGGFALSKNGSAGSTSFTTSSSAILDDVSQVGINRVPIWNRSVATNGKIHTISNYWFSDANNVPLVTRNGVGSPTTYSRWNIAEDKAEVEHIILPGYDSTLYTSGGGDSYAIDARDSIIAILIGGFADPVSLWKSTNNGETWTYTDVDQLQYKGLAGAKAALAALDTFNSNDGSLDVIIDNEGVVHAYWGLCRALGSVSTTTGDTGYSGFLTSASLVHWKEGDTETQLIGGAVDRNGNGQLDFNSETFASLGEGSVVPNGLSSAARVGNTNLVTMPSASVDAEGNLFVIYSSPIEDQLHFLLANFRDIHVMYSTDGGDTWGDPQNITQNATLEDNFPCAAKMADDFLHLVYQEDETPGTFLQNHSPANGTHFNDLNTIKYAAVPTSDIMSDLLGNDVLTSVKEANQAKIFVVSQNQPNPFTGTSDVIIYLREGSDVTITVSDVLGNIVNEGNVGRLGAGNHTVTLDANGLTAGMYFYTLSTRDHSVTKKMQVK